MAGKDAKLPSPLMYCAELPPGAKAWVWLVVVTEFVDASVVEPGVPRVTDPAPVIVLKFRPLPADTLVTVPVQVVFVFN
jgi:hypothetical protein